MEGTAQFDLRKISGRPYMICTIHGDDCENAASAKLIALLAERLTGKGVVCIAFKDPENYECAREAMPPEKMVVLFDRRWRGNYFKPIFRGTAGHLFPKWAEGAWWGVLVDPDIEERGRMNSAKNQIIADFHENFGDNLAAGLLPYGAAKDPNSGKNRKKKKRAKMERKSRGRAPWLGGAGTQSRPA